MNGATVDQDEEHLRLLAIFHYVVGGIMAFFACFGLIYVAMGLVFVSTPQAFNPARAAGPPPEVFGLLFAVVGGVVVLVGWTVAALLIFAGRSLARRKRYVFCLVMAAIACLFMPLGTVLGVFTLIVLMRPSVKALFSAAPLPT